MTESIVKIPRNSTIDYDFIAFSFNGKHSYEDMNIVRVSDGSRYNENLSPSISDLTAEVPGGDGMYYFNTHHKQKVFNINFAFDCLEEEQLSELRKWLNGKDMADLWFAEAPYKVYTAKVTGQPNIKFLCFEDKNVRLYKGEGTVQFTAYWPYAHTPDKIQRYDKNTDSWVDVGSGIVYSNYQLFRNYKQFEDQLPGRNGKYGDLPFYFVADLIDPKYVSTSVIKLDSTQSNGLSIEYTNATTSSTNGVTTVAFREGT